MDNKEVGLRIKSRRKDLKLTLKDVADIVGVASSTIQRYENGTITQLKLPVLEAIAKALNVNPTWFMRKDANPDLSVSETKEQILISYFNKLNDTGKTEAIKRVKELSDLDVYNKDSKVLNMSDYNEPLHLMPIASHDKEGDFTEEDYKHDDDIMNDPDLWK